MNEIQKINALIAQVDQERKKKKNQLPSNAYYLDEDTIVQRKKVFGDSRYLYTDSGMSLWAYASGNIVMSEGIFFIIPETTGGVGAKESCFSLYSGIKKGKFYESHPLLSDNGGINSLDNYVIFTPECCYYVSEDKEMRYVVRIGAFPKKKAVFSIFIFNLSKEQKDTLTTFYLNPLLFNAPTDNYESKWYEASEKRKSGYYFRSYECVNRLQAYKHYAFLKVLGRGKRSFTTSHSEFAGGYNHLSYMAPCLKTGRLSSRIHTEFIDTPIGAECVKKTIPASSYARFDYILSYTDSLKEEGTFEQEVFTRESIDCHYLEEVEKRKKSPRIHLCPTFIGGKGDFKGKDYLLTSFFHGLTKQIEVVSKSNNYAGDMLGVRDIFQQLEAFIPIDPEYCKGKMVDALNYINVDGRAPRQYSYGAKTKTPKLDMREYIDQGLWIISCFYTYLAFTGDYSILDLECGYLDFSDDVVKETKQRDSVFCHLKRILDYLISNLDPETHCLHILYGDWNDAIDALGITKDKNKKFGTGVSIMASEQLYDCLNKFMEILSVLHKDNQEISSYQETNDKIEKGILEYGIQDNNRILHGWGDKRSYYIGSHCDFDGKDRVSITPNSFFVLSGLMDKKTEMKKHILEAFARLDYNSPYGMKVIEPGFQDGDSQAGRISRLPIGTAENGGTYNHGTVFGAYALMKLGEGKKAYQQLVKVLPFFHKSISTSPFVMGNSYVRNLSIGVDGETMNDWFTGSSTVVFKMFLFEIFGIHLTLKDLTIDPCSYFPFKKAEIHVTIRNSSLHLVLEEGKNRKVYLNQKEVDSIKIPLSILDEKKTFEIHCFLSDDKKE